MSCCSKKYRNNTAYYQEASRTLPGKQPSRLRELIWPSCLVCRGVRFTILVLGAVLLFTLTGCGSPEPKNKCFDKSVELSPEEQELCRQQAATRTYQHLYIPAFDPNAVPFQVYGR